MGSPNLQIANTLQQQCSELVEHGTMNQDALHRDAGLAGVENPPGDTAVCGVRQVGIAVHDDSRIATEFQSDPLFTGA